jgi:hypothetical protein
VSLDPASALRRSCGQSRASNVCLELCRNFTTFKGARTTVDDVESDVEQQGIRFGATLVLPVNRYQSVKLYSISGYNAHREHDFQAFGIAWQYRWGGGF